MSWGRLLLWLSWEEEEEEVSWYASYRVRDAPLSAGAWSQRLRSRFRNTGSREVPVVLFVMISSM